MKLAGRALTVLAIAFIACGVARADGPARHLVYKFTYGSASNIEVHTSGLNIRDPDPSHNEMNSSGSGVASYTNGIADEGTITVDVMKLEPDRGLILSVSEQSLHNRSSRATKCVVYGFTLAVACDPNATMYDEEFAVIRLLGANFVDPARIDDKRHWQVDSGSGGVENISDFTIAQNTDGKMVIKETSLQKDRSHGRESRTDGDSTIGYDYIRGVPTSLNLITMNREPQGMDQYRTLRIEIIATLASDSGVAVTP